jgi:hypothetical protein
VAYPSFRPVNSFRARSLGLLKVIGRGGQLRDVEILERPEAEHLG